MADQVKAMAPLSRYFPDVYAFARGAQAKAAYCFVVDGKHGTGGCPVVVGLDNMLQSRELCLELVAMLRRSADLLEADVAGEVSLPPSSPE